MSILQALILGIVQGLTEFLPISSSAHLVLVPFFFGWVFPKDQAFAFDVIVQLGTLAAVIVYFWKDLWQILQGFFRGLLARKPFESLESRLGWYLILATIPAGLFGLLIKDQVEAAFGSPFATGLFLLATAGLLIAGELLGKKTRNLESFGWLDALVMGLGQAAAVFPGISRSGATISTGMLRGLDRPSAARFSFLMAVPVMLAAGGLSVLDLLDMQGLGDFLLPLGVGFLAAGVVGFLSIHLLLKLISRTSFIGFALYCIALSLLTTAFSFFIAPSLREPAAAEAPQIFEIQISPSLGSLGDEMNRCMEYLPGEGLVLDERPAANFDTLFSGISLRWGAPQPIIGQAYTLGEDRLAVIANPANPLDEISLDGLKKIYAGAAANWNELGGADEAVKAWSYTEAEDAYQLFSQYLGNPAEPGAIWIAADPTAMLRWVGQESGAVGYLPQSWVDGSVKVLRINGGEPPAAPVLAILPLDLTPSQQTFLNCLQLELNPTP